jgi:SPP1 gp7 family putative phage head morphogenesis protein
VPDNLDIDWAAEEAALFAALYPQVLDAAKRGAANALPGGAGVAIDWRLVNKDVVAWAGRYTAELVKGITATTKAAAQAAIAAWIESGEPLPTLLKALEPIFGKARADMIGITEVTRAFAEGNRRVWTDVGASGMTWMTAQDEIVCDICGELAAKTVAIDGEFQQADFAGIPPAHPRCRCYLQPEIKLPGGR